uniref:Uncharacterized protein n=1 Tax=Salix viminalis TaxID=40686 RepID=A0A6N2LNH9_SALVM
MDTVNSNFQEKSTLLSVPSPNPGHILLPTPKGIIFTPETPVMSASSPPEMNRSGLNFSGWFHTFGSSPIP